MEESKVASLLGRLKRAANESLVKGHDFAWGHADFTVVGWLELLEAVQALADLMGVEAVEQPYSLYVESPVNAADIPASDPIQTVYTEEPVKLSEDFVEYLELSEEIAKEPADEEENV